MSNQIKVSAKVFGESWRRVENFKAKNKANPKTVGVNGTTVQWADWKRAYDIIAKNKIGKYTFNQFADSYNRYSDWYNKNKKNPKTVRVSTDTLSWTNWLKLHQNTFNKLTVTINMPSTLVVQKTEDIKQVETTKDPEIIPIFHFNQQTVPGWGEVCCAPVSACICASAFGEVDRSNFQKVALDLIRAMQTGSKGTGPKEMITGFNSYFKNLTMYEEPFTEANIKKNVKKQNPMVWNHMTGPDLGYKGRFPHYSTVTGHNGQCGCSDPHGFNIGRGHRCWYNFNILDKANKANFNRPLYVVAKK